MSKIKVGSKIQVREDLELGKKYKTESIVSPMMQYAGKTGTVIGDGATAPRSAARTWRISTDNGSWHWPRRALKLIE